MIRSSQIPSLLHRISGNGIIAAMVVTADGELLGTSYRKHSERISDTATLITDVILDYIRLGTELHQFKLQYVEMEMSHGTIGVASAGPECFVIALAEETVASGLLKSRVLACGAHVQDSLMPMTDAS
jgi:predicted regulator of Ras-like GTPase activity (Roadblock/LC7/MglB family)